MSRNKNYSSSLTEKGCCDGFGGIDRRGPFTAPRNACFDLQNLRLFPDGSLRSRHGYSYRGSLYSAPRAILSDFINGKPCLYALCLDTVFAFNPDGSSYPVGMINSESGDAALIRHGGAIYVLDGIDLYRKGDDDQEFEAVNGYAPLYGDGWDPVKGGNVNEPLNIISRYFRIRFFTGTEGADRVAFRLPFSEINFITLNGAEVSPSSLGITATSGDGSAVSASLPADSEIVFWLTLPWSEYHREDLTSCVNALSLGELTDGRICCFGGEQQGEMFISRPVPDSSLQDALRGFGAVSNLYFPVASRITVGEGRHPIRSVCRYYNRQLIFTSGDAWVMNWEGGEDDPRVYMPRIRRISHALGITDTSATLFCDGTVLTFSGEKFYRWSSTSEIATRFSSVPISEGITDLLPVGEGSICSGTVDEEKGEAWFTFPNDSLGRCFVWNYRLKAWYVFSGIYADRLFRWGNSVAFIRGQELYAFDDALSVDVDEDGESRIPVSVTSDWLDFGHPERQKRGVWVILRHGGHPVNVSLTDSFGCQRNALMGGENSRGDTPLEGFAEDRIDFGSFRFLRCSLSSSGDSPVILRSICLYTD